MNVNLINAQNAFQNRKFQKALELFQQEISNHPENLDAYFGAGRCLFMLKRLSEVIDIADRMIGLEPNSAMAHVLKAQAYGRLKEVPKSKSEIEFAYSLEPNNSNVLFSYGHLLLHYGKWDEGVTYLEKALEQDPTILYAHLNLGFAYQKKGNPEKALYHAKKIYEISPSLKNRIRLIYAHLNRIGVLIPTIVSVILAFIVSAIFQEFVLSSIIGLILLLLIYFRIIFQTP
jgi:tetratricopeptide (TPR) repeat protein